jgi:hypothetical protein
MISLYHGYIAGAFVPGKSTQQTANLQTSAIRLLALASCRRDSPTSVGGESALEEEEEEQEEHSFPLRLQATSSALRSTLELLQHAQTGKVAPEDLVLARQVLEIPLACVALLHYMQVLLSHREYFHEAAAPGTTAILSRIAVAVAKRGHPVLLSLVSALVGGPMEGGWGTGRRAVSFSVDSMACLPSSMGYSRDSSKVQSD